MDDKGLQDDGKGQEVEGYGQKMDEKGQEEDGKGQEVNFLMGRKWMKRCKKLLAKDRQWNAICRKWMK